MGSFWYIIRVGDTGRGGEHDPQHFCIAKREKRSKKKKEFQSRNCYKAVLAMLQGCFRASRIYKFFLAANHGD